MRRMGGKAWRRLHRLVYFAAIAGCIHYWWLVKTGVMAPLPFTLVLTALFFARVIWTLTHRKPSQPKPRAATVP